MQNAISQVPEVVLPLAFQRDDFNADLTLLQQQIAEHREVETSTAATVKITELAGYVIQAATYLTLRRWGGLSAPLVLEAIAAKRYDTKSADPYFNAVQLVENRTRLTAITDKKAKKDRRNQLTRRAKLLAGLEKADEAGKFLNLNAEQIGQWIEDQGGIDGIIRDWLSVQADNDNEEDEGFDPSPFEAAVLGGFSVPAPDELSAYAPTISIHRRIAGETQDNLLVLPLPGIPADLMERLKLYLPAEDSHIVPDLRFWSNVAVLSAMFDRQNSDIVMRPDDIQHEGTARLPSGPIIRLLDEKRFRIAASRQQAGMVVHLTASSGLNLGLGDRLTEQRHINVRGSGLLVDRLVATSSRVAFDLDADARKSAGALAGKVDDQATGLSFRSNRTDVADFKVPLLPMSKFGSSKVTRQWTLDVRLDEYVPRANAVVELTAGILPEALATLAGKASASKHPVIVKISTGVLHLALGKSHPLALASAGEGTESVEVSAADFARLETAMRRIKPASLEVCIDPAGLVEFRFAAAGVEFSAFLPVTKDGKRSEKLLREVERPQPAADPQAEEFVSAADTTPGTEAAPTA